MAESDKKTSGSDNEGQQSKAAPSSPPEDTYPTSQLVDDGPKILGQPSYVVAVALKRHGGNRKTHTLDQAKDALDKLNKKVEA